MEKLLLILKAIEILLPILGRILGLLTDDELVAAKTIVKEEIGKAIDSA